MKNSNLLDSITHALVALQSGSYFSGLVEAPKPHSRRQVPKVMATRSGRKQDQPVHTIVMPVFEHERILAQNLSLLEESSTLSHDLVLIDDGSSDSSSRVASEFIQRDWEYLNDACVVRNDVPIFETACDNFAFVASVTPVVVEVQADIQIREKGFDRLVVEALTQFPDASTVSGRAGHAFAAPPNFWLWDKRKFSERELASAVGLMNQSIEGAETAEKYRGRVYRCETVNRGPWGLRKKDLELYGYLDERHYFLGGDDHDLHRRMYQREGRRPLYVPMRISSPLSDGAQRRVRQGINAEVWRELKGQKTGNPEFRSFVRSLKGTRTAPEPLDWPSMNPYSATR